jgi:hypothetical protein
LVNNKTKWFGDIPAILAMATRLMFAPVFAWMWSMTLAILLLTMLASFHFANDTARTVVRCSGFGQFFRIIGLKNRDSANGGMILLLGFSVRRR